MKMVIGDVMLDAVMGGSIRRISPEAPVPIYDQVSMSATLGGAANCFANMSQAYPDTELAGVIGPDQAGEAIREIIDQNFPDRRAHEYVVTLKSYSTIEKLRLYADDKYVYRIDKETGTLYMEEYLEFLDRVMEPLWNSKLIVISDYNKGCISPKLMDSVRSTGKPMVVDSKRTDLSIFHGAHVYCPNLKELMTLGLGRSAEAAAAIVAEKYDFKYVTVTLGKHGAMLWDSEKRAVTHYPVDTVEGADVVGAGDVFTAYLSAYYDDFGIEDAVQRAVDAASVSVAFASTTVVTPDVINIIKHKEVRDEELIRRMYPEAKIVYVNGCFDLLHLGHLETLRFAKKLGDLLVVGVNSDESVKRIKGDSRPVQGLETRMAVLRALDFVDVVCSFDDDTPLEQIKKVSPNLIVRGEKDKGEPVVGASLVEGVAYAPSVGDHSTTAIIDALVK